MLTLVTMVDCHHRPAIVMPERIILTPPELLTPTDCDNNYDYGDPEQLRCPHSAVKLDYARPNSIAAGPATHLSQLQSALLRWPSAHHSDSKVRQDKGLDG